MAFIDRLPAPFRPGCARARVVALVATLCLTLAPSARAQDMPFTFVITGKMTFEGVAKLSYRHFSGDATSGSANVHLEGDIRHGEITVQATGDMLPQFGVEHNLLASGTYRPAIGKIQFPLQFSSSHGQIANVLTIELPNEPPSANAGFGVTSAPVTTAVEPIDQTYVAVVAAKVREKPDPLSARIKTIDVGQKVTVVGRLKGLDWYLVSENDKPLGYVLVDQLVPESQYQPSGTPNISPPLSAGPPIDISKLDFGHYVALVIGNDAYEHGLQPLRTGVADAKAVSEKLQSKFGFKTTLLTNATREEVFEALTQLRLTLGWNDNLLIYFAGRGSYDEAGGQGYWLPVDAALQDPTNWVSNTDVTTMLRAIQARHVLVVADSCYHGALTPDSYAGARDANYISQVIQRRARTVMVSGDLAPAPASGSTLSPFTLAFLAALQHGTRIEDAQSVFARMRDSMAESRTETPQYSSIGSAGHQGGEFVFVRSQ